MWIERVYIIYWSCVTCLYNVSKFFIFIQNFLLEAQVFIFSQEEEHPFILVG